MFICLLGHTVPKHAHRRVQDRINYAMKSRTEALTAENTPWIRVFTLVIETQLGITCLKLQDGKPNVAERVVKTEGTKHLTWNSKITFS